MGFYPGKGLHQVHNPFYIILVGLTEDGVDAKFKVGVFINEFSKGLAGLQGFPVGTWNPAQFVMDLFRAIQGKLYHNGAFGTLLQDGFHRMINCLLQQAVGGQKNDCRLVDSVKKLCYFNQVGTQKNFAAGKGQPQKFAKLRS